MPDAPLCGQLHGGPLDGAAVTVDPALDLRVGVGDGTPGVTHIYVVSLAVEARFQYVETIKEKPKATKLLKGGLDSRAS
jgi:hypothetical protein